MVDHRLHASLLTVLAGAFLSAAASAQERRFEILDLNDLNPTSFGFLFDIDEQGRIVGTSDIDGPDFRATAWSGGIATNLGIVPGDTASDAIAINEGGTIVGVSTLVDDTGHLIFFYPTVVVWDDRSDPVELQSLITSGENWELLYVSDINDRGQIIGTGRDLDLEEPRAWIFEDGIMTDLGTMGGFSTDPCAINNAGIVVGQSWTSGGQNHGFVWRDGEFTDLGTLGGRDSKAFDINELNQVVGWAQSPTAPTLAVKWEDGVMSQLGTLGGNQSHASAINNLGQIVGFSVDENYHAHMFLWEDGVMINPAEFIPDGLGFGGRANAQDINDAGQIIGTLYREGRGDAPVMLMEVFLDLASPEPGNAGEVNTVTVGNAEPGHRIYLAYGVNPGMSTIPGCPGATVLIDDPRVAGSAIADATGEATLSGFVPAAASGQTLRLQAVDPARCEVSNVVTHTF